MGGDGGIGLFRPQDRVRPAFLRLKEDVDLGTGGKGMSLNGLSCGDLQSSRPCISADEGAVEAALSREELSVVEEVFVLEAPLPRLLPIFTNILSSSKCGNGFFASGAVATFPNFTPPSKELLPVPGRSKTLNECSAGASATSSNTFVDDFRRPNPFGNLGI